MSKKTDFYKPDQFHEITSQLGDLEKRGDEIIRENRDDNEENVRTLETARRSAPIIKKNGKPAKRWELFRSKIRGKSSLLAVILVLFGGGSAISIFSAPSLVIVQLKEVLTQDLNDQVKSLDRRSSLMLRAKLKDATKGSCGAVKVACKFSSMNDDQVDQFRKAGITVVREPSPEGSKRAVVKEITFIDKDTGKKVTTTSAEEFTKLSMNNMTLRSNLIKAYNPAYVSTTDGTARGVYKFFKIDRSKTIEGNTDEERRKNLDESVKNGDEIKTNSLRPQLNDKNEPTGNYIDNDGNVFTEEQKAGIEQTSEVAGKASNLGTAKIASSVVNGLKVNATLDTGCSLWTANRAFVATAKTVMLARSARYATKVILGPADEIKAENGNEAKTNMVGTILMTPVEDTETVDETKIDKAGTDTSLKPEKTVSNKTAFDSPGPSTSLNGYSGPLDLRAQRFVAGGGFVGSMAKMNQIVAKAIPGANGDPRRINKICKVVKNPLVQIGALAAGIAVGAGSFGLSTAAGVAGSLMVSMALPFVLSKTADAASGKTFENLTGEDAGSAGFLGTSSLLGEMSKKRGMKPLSAKEAIVYTNTTRQTYDEIAKTERHMAKSTPLDIMNQYSFAGTLVRSVTPTIRSTNSSASSVAMSLANFAPAALTGSLARTAHADNGIERFEQCNDPEYKRLNIGADIFCNVRYGLSDAELGMDPIENAKWMAETGNIDPNSEEGEVVDNGKPWNYKKYLDECVNRADGWGEEGEEGGPDDGWACVAPENEALNKHFRVFTFDKSVSDSMDGQTTPVLPGTTGMNTGEKGHVSAEGWAYPGSPSSQKSQAFHAPEHKGIDIADNMGKPIFAARDGIVLKAGPAQGFGNWIILSHNIDGKRVDTVYGHMYNDGVLVKTGDTVKAGQLIGKVGSNGQSTGPHLHFEMWEGGYSDGRPIDPEPIIMKARRR